jgi:hypothetical protein
MEKTTSARAGSDPSELVDALRVADHGPQDRFDRIVRTARDVFDVPMSYLNLVDEDFVHTLTPTVPGEARPVPADCSFCQFTVQSTETLVIPDTTADVRTASLPGVTRHGIRFYAGVPITMPGGIRVGSLCLMDTRPRVLTDEEEAALVDLAQWAERLLADGLQNDRLRAVVDATRPTDIVVPGYEVTGFSIPLQGELGGDMYDWSDGVDGVSFTLVDVMGKGRAAGMLAAGLRGALRARAGEAPDRAIAELEAQIAAELARVESFATLFHARLAPPSGRVDFVDAGHGIVLHLRADGSANVVRSLDLPIGLHPAGLPRASGSLVLHPGDTLLVASDGVLDLGDGTLDALKLLGEQYREAGDPLVFEAVVRERAHNLAEDDITLIVVHRS